MNELYERFRTAFRATGYVTDDQSCELAEIAEKISNRSRHVSMTVKVDNEGLGEHLTAVMQRELAAFGLIPNELGGANIPPVPQDTRLHAWQYKGHYLFAHDRAEAASLMSWKVDHDGPMLAMEDFYRVCEAALDVEQDVGAGKATLRELLECARSDDHEGYYLCPIPLPAIGARINSSLGPGHVASAEDKDGYRAVVNQLDSGGTELCAHNWSYIPEEYVWSDDFGRGEMQKLSHKEWLEQYTCTPRPTREVIVDALLSGASNHNYSREYLSTLPDVDLLRVARFGGVGKSLWQSFRRQLDNAERWPTTPDGKPLVEDSVNFPGKARPFIVLDEPWIRHDGGPCPVRHEEVLVYTRSQYSAEHQFAKALALRGMPERFNWNWGRPDANVCPNDVMQWRKAP